MSRYTLLFILNIPFIIISLIKLVTEYKLNKVSNRYFIVKVMFWITIMLGLMFIEPIYIWLYNQKLTISEPLSLFDVVQITAIVIVLYISDRTRSKLETTDRKLRDLHQELSIILSNKKQN